MNSPMLRSIGLLILRLGMGGYMLTHGWGKMQMVIDGQYEGLGDPIGIGAMPSLLLVTFAEFFCAIFVMIGAATRLAVIPLMVTMAVAALKVHGSDPWTLQGAYELAQSTGASPGASKQVPLMFLIPFLALFFTGAGGLSIDSAVQKQMASRKAKEKKEQAAG